MAHLTRPAEISGVSAGLFPETAAGNRAYCKFKGHKLQASTVNIFARQNLQFELPQNFISHNDSGSLTLSIEYHFYRAIHVPGWEFSR